jgi:hypothetical protein
LQRKGFGMPKLELPFAAQDSKTGLTQNSREQLLNMYSEVIQHGGKSKLVRRQRPGLTVSEQLPTIKRGIAKFTHGHYLVARNIAYKWDGSTLIQLGNLNTNIGPVTIISDENDNVLISDGVDAYHYEQTTGQWTLPVMPSEVGTLAFISGYGIFNEPGTGRWYYSDLNDLTTWNALNFFTAEGDADFLVRVFVDKNEILFFGTDTLEFWRLVGGDDVFSYNTYAQRGCIAPFSVAAEDNSVFWVGNDKMVYRIDGYRPARISTHAIEEWIEGAPSPEDGYAFIYTFRGHKFYVLTFPGYGTRQYDISNGLWYVAETWDEAEWKIIGGAGRAVDFYLTPSAIVMLDGTVNTDEGGIMERGGVSAPLYFGGERFTIPEMFLDVEVGRVAATSAEPQIMMQVSRNGETFGNVRQRGLGLTGNYARRVVFRNLGQAREATVKITVTDDVNFAFMTGPTEVKQ